MLSEEFQIYIAIKWGMDHIDRPGCELTPMEPEEPRTIDTAEQVGRCLHCPYKSCDNPETCAFRRTGVIKDPKAPKGYDAEVMAEVMPRVYTTKDLMRALGVNEYRARQYMDFYYKEVNHARED